MMKPLPQSVQELADEFGLSRVTVSYILNDRWREKRIAEKTARKVLAYVHATGFQPNTFGQALRGESLKEIAILLPVNPLAHHRNALFQMLRRLEEQERSYLVLPFAPGSLPNTLYFLKNCRIPQVVIFAAAIDPDTLPTWRQLLANLADARVLFYDFPFHVVSPEEFHFLPNPAFVGIDRRAATQRILDYIRDAGYRDWWLNEYYRDIPGLTIPPEVKVHYYPSRETGWSHWRETGEFIGSQLLRCAPRAEPCAVYINDDKTTWAAIHYLSVRGVGIPEEFAFISWDGLEESEFVRIPLTTLMIPHAQMMAYAIAWCQNPDRAHEPVQLIPQIAPGASLPPLARH